MARSKVWFKVLEPDELPEGRVVSKTCGHQNLCVTHFEGQYAALDNRCPHQGGPLGEGSIENGWLRCPWHGWDYHPLTGRSPGSYEDGIETFSVETRDDGIYVGLEQEAAHETTVSDIIAKTLTNWGIRWCFGMVGHSNLGLADALRRETAAGRLSYVGVRHESAASFAASAYGKLTGRPAACLSIAGPGATNLLTGLWDANVDRAPVVALTGQVQTQVLGRGAFQEIDLKAAFGRVAQFSATVLHYSNHAELASLAVKSALLNEGVSHLIFPDEVQVRIADEDAEAMEPTGRLVTRNLSPDQGQLDVAIELLAAAERPCFIVGHGARFQMDDIRALAEELNCPVVTTFKGKGLISDHHPLGGGVLGRSGTPIASWFMNESDLLMVMGSSFAKHTGITPKKPILQIDRDPMVLGKKFPVTAPVLGDIGQIVRRLREAMKSQGHKAVDRRGEIAERWAIWRQEKARRHREGGEAGIHSITVFESLADAVDDDAIICVDVGNNTYSFGRYFESKGQPVLMSGYLGSIGFSVPAAMGAWAATQEAGSPWHGRQVVSVSGDGGLGQYLADFTTWLNCGMNLTHVVLNNGELGKISKEQRGANFDVWQTSLTNPSFAAFAENCGALGIRVEDPAELPAALRKALDHKGAAMVEVITDVNLI